MILLLILLLFPNLSNAATTALYPTYDTKLNPAATSTNYDSNTRCSSFSGSNGVANSDDTACLIIFDLSSFTDPDAIASASLRLYADTRGYAQNFYLSRMVQSWVSNQATWNVYSTGNNWGTSGAKNSTTDYTTSGQYTLAAPDGGYVTVDVTQMVKDMITYGNKGFLLRPDNGDMYLSWYTSEATGTTNDPLLTIRTSTPGVTPVVYVRPNGGTCGLGNQCDGFTNADYPGSGTDQACACALPSQADNLTYGEDIMQIARGTYNDSGIVIPAGTSTSLRTIVRGEDYANCTDDTAVTIWSNSGSSIINFNSHTFGDCFTVTDHIGSGDSHIADNPDGAGVSTTGILITADSTDIVLRNVTSYGLYRGLFAQRLGDFTGTNLRLVGNFSAGWDSDGSGDDSYTGTVTLNNATISWNGCATKYPLSNSSDLTDSSNFKYCCTQAQGCYGDGIGLGDGSAGIWEFNGGKFNNNTSDAIDTLHGTTTLQSVKNITSEGNVGQAVKITGSTVILEDSKITGNCGYFDDKSYATTPDQQSSIVGMYNGNSHSGYVYLTGTGIAVTNETIGTGDGSTLVFSGTTANFPIKETSNRPSISYTISGVTYTVTAGAIPTSGDGYGSTLGLITGTGITSGSSSSYINYQTGAYKITFTTAPDNATTIKFNSYTYNDGVASGTFTGDRTNQTRTSWDVVIDGNGTPDTFKWRKTANGVAGSYTTGVAITGSAQVLGEGVSFQFKQTTGHTIGDSYVFTTVGAPFESCRALGTPIALAVAQGSNAYVANNTIMSNGDITLYMSIRSGGSCNGTERVYSRNNIYINGAQFGQEAFSEQSRQFYIDSPSCVIGTVFDSDYDIACGGKVTTDCTSEGAHNICHSSCSANPIGFTTAPDYGPSPYYTGNDLDISLASGSEARDAAIENPTNSDVYDIQYYDRGASWDIGALEYGSVAATCSDGVMNGLETDIDCGGICTAQCDYLSSSRASGIMRLIGNVKIY